MTMSLNLMNQATDRTAARFVFPTNASTTKVCGL